MTGVDTAEERLHEPLGHRRSQPVGDEGGDVAVLRLQAGRQLGADAVDLRRRQQAAQGPRIGGHAHERAARQRVDGAPAPHLRRCAAGVDEVTGQPGPTHQVARLRASHEEGLRPHVEGPAGDGLAPQLAPDPVGDFEEGDPRGRVPAGDLLGRRQPADASPDDEVGGRAGRHTDHLLIRASRPRHQRPVTRS